MFQRTVLFVLLSGVLVGGAAMGSVDSGTVTSHSGASSRLFAMRFDDNHTPGQWRQVADIFERHGLRVSFAVTAVSLSDEQGACLAELSRRGHEIMDHTPQHAIYQQEFRDVTSFVARTNRSYVADWDAARRRIYCKAEIDWNNRSVFRFKGSIRNGEVVVRDPAALRRLYFTAKFYVPSVRRWFGVRKIEGDRRQIADFWGRDVKDVVVPETEMVTLYQDGIQPSDELLRDQCLTTRKIFDRFGIARPTCWIQPGGWEPFLDWKVLKRVCGGEFGYVAADSVVGIASGSNAWSLRPSFDYFDKGENLEGVTNRVVDALAKGRHFIYISHMQGAGAGGWEKWLGETEAFAAWLEKSGIAVVTYSELARRLFGTSGEAPMRVALTFDDALKDHLLIAAPMLEARGWRGVFNIVTDWVGRDEKKLSWDDVCELIRRGHEVTTHTASHPNLVKLLELGRTNEVRRQIAASRDVIYRKTGFLPRYMCAPYVQQNKTTARICHEEGLEQMAVRRVGFGGGNQGRTTAILEDLLKQGCACADLLHHGVSAADNGGHDAFTNAEAFAEHLDRIAALEKDGRIRVTGYDGLMRQSPTRTDNER